MKFQHDSYENEQNAGRAHLAMKWGYRAHNVLLIAIQLYVVLLPLPLYLKALGLVLLALGIWINGEAAQWHARATDDHHARAEVLRTADEQQHPEYGNVRPGEKVSKPEHLSRPEKWTIPPAAKGAGA